MGRGRNRRKNVGSVCLRSECFHSLLLQGASHLHAKKSQKIRNFRAAREATSCISELSSAGFFPLVPGSVGGVPPLLLCILNVVADYSNAFNQIFGGFYFSVKRAHRGWYVLSKSHAVSDAVCVSSMIQKSPQSHCR